MCVCVSVSQGPALTLKILKCVCVRVSVCVRESVCVRVSVCVCVCVCV